MLSERRVVIHRLKYGTQGDHPLPDDEVAALVALPEAYPDSPYLFPDERGDHIRLIQEWLGLCSAEYMERYTKLNLARFEQISWV
jgi:hypothetical protein